MESDSECDWNPPEEVIMVESEVFQIPSELPSLEDFIKSELEKEAASAKARAESGDGVEVGLETIQMAQDVLPEAEPFPDEGSIAEVLSEDEAASIADEAFSEDEVKVAPQVKPKKPQIIDDLFGLDTMKIDFNQMEQDAKEKEAEALRLHLVTSTNAFIDTVIGKVVETCEYEDPDDILRARLDKDKICAELEAKMFQLDIEQKVRLFLNRKTVEYFRRKKSTRPLIDDSPDQVLIQLRKYREALMKLNKFKGVEETTRSLLETKAADLRQQILELETQSKRKNMEFEDLVKMVLCEEPSEKMEALIENSAKKMRNLQKEISKVRFVLIQHQHTMAVLQDKARKLEDLGNGLRMLDFEHLETETQALGKKIEERNNELSRLHSRCNADIHTIAHIREKQIMTRNTISAQQEALDELIEEKQGCREYLNEVKIERATIRRELQKLSFQSGLLDKPDLLLDFDATEEKANVLRQKITQMKAKQQIVDEKLKNITSMLS